MSPSPDLIVPDLPSLPSAWVFTAILGTYLRFRSSNTITTHFNWRRTVVRTHVGVFGYRCWNQTAR